MIIPPKKPKKPKLHSSQLNSTQLDTWLCYFFFIWTLEREEDIWKWKFLYE